MIRRWFRSVPIKVDLTNCRFCHGVFHSTPSTQRSPIHNNSWSLTVQNNNNRHYHKSKIIQRHQKSKRAVSNKDTKPSTTSKITTVVFDRNSDINKLSVKEIKVELESYGIDTKPLFEKQDLLAAIQKAREQQLLPMINAMTAMKYELVHEIQVTNIDKFLERSEMESEFLQKCASVRSNMNSIVIQNSTDHDGSANTGGSQHRAAATNDDDDDNNNSRDVHVELIYDEMKSIYQKISIQEMHTELEQQLRVSPFQLLQSCVAIARIDGIVSDTSVSEDDDNDDDETDSSSNDTDTNSGTSTTNNKHRLMPSELWHSMKVQDIVAASYVDSSDRRKSILPSSSSSSSDRAVRIQKELKELESSSMKQLFNELENVWGISPRCIYVCTIAVLRVLNVIDPQQQQPHVDENVEQQQQQEEEETVDMNDPMIHSMVGRAMANPQMDTLLSQTLTQPHIRQMVMEYMNNPTTFKPNVQNDPQIQQLFANPIFKQQMEHIIKGTTADSIPENKNDDAHSKQKDEIK